MKNIFGRTEENWYLEELIQDQRVEYSIDNGITIKTGVICGMANTGVPIAGKTYIIKPDEEISVSEYKYSHIVMPEVLINPIK